MYPYALLIVVCVIPQLSHRQGETLFLRHRNW